VTLRGAWPCVLFAGFLVIARPAVAADAPATADPVRAIAIAEDERRYADGELKRYLASADAAIRARAVLAVGRIQDSTSVADLLPLLRDPDLEVKRSTVFALGQIGHRSARIAVEGALNDPDHETVDLAIEALGKLGDRAATPKVASFLRDPLPLLRGEAAVALWRLADSTAIDALIERHSDPDPEVRWRVLYALEKIVNPARIVLIMALHVDDPEWMVRAHAARTMGRQKSPRGTAYLLQKLDDAEPAVVVNALRGLQQIGDSTCGPCMNRLLRALEHGDPYVRVTAAGVIGEHAVIASADSGVRRQAIESLAAHTRDLDAATRGASARSLIAILGEPALPMVRFLLADSSVYVRVAVIQALGRLPAAAALPLLEPRIASTTPLFERMTAIEAIGALKARSKAPVVRAMLTDSSVLIVASAAAALAELGDSSSVRALSRVYASHAADADPDARMALHDALATLAGRGFADSLERAHPARAAKRPDYPPDFHVPPPQRGAILHTTAGEIEWAFYGAEAPQTVKNFVRLAKARYFDGLAVHRVVPDFVIQDGDPTGTGSGGPGYTIRCEYNRLRYDAGMVGMALSGKDTGGSQWFITHSPQLHLNGRYTIFAHVTRGMDVARRIVQGDRILRVEILPQ
jgi:cyclophilin family peptidyl-prolyl cis-trans isomerase/HEAT repeat protein